ncbi:hypothetical protein LIER_18312 [Lithospermum erythrorhizon]|uniref:UspA domain-containing protein n=1 Tax=Lithospermum erythrorhizon TaxID=34254 RepID=A0AAV3QHM4_LITER
MPSRIILDESEYITHDIINNCILKRNHTMEYEGSGGGNLDMISEIQEVGEENEGNYLSFEVNNNGGQLETIEEEGSETSSLFSFDYRSHTTEIIHVGIIEKHEETSMDAVHWALSNFVNPISNVVCLVYIFPIANKIHTLLGKMAIGQANTQQQEIHLAYEEYKKKHYLMKFRNVCEAFEVNVDTVSVESHMKERALLKLIPMLHISKLVVGLTKRSISKKGGGAAGHILRGAPQNCEMKIICEGKEVGNEILGVAHHNGEASEYESTSTTGTATPEGFMQFRDHLELRQASLNSNNNTKCNNRLCGVSCFKPKVNG